jgi:hypothetical protein
MNPELPGPPMTLGNMRAQGVHHLIAFCLRRIVPASVADPRREIFGCSFSDVLAILRNALRKMIGNQNKIGIADIRTLGL